MKKYLWTFFILILIGGIIVFIFSDRNNGESSYVAEKTGNDNQNLDAGSWELENRSKDNEQDESEETEEKITEFSTRLPNDTEARDHNIKLACKTLNGTIVEKRKSFFTMGSIRVPYRRKRL